MLDLVRLRCFQGGVAVGATLTTVLLVHWLLVQPPPVALRDHELSALAAAVLEFPGDAAGSIGPLRVLMTLMAATALLASGLGAVLALRAPTSAAVRWLSAGLVGGSRSGAYFFFVTTHEVYRHLFGWQPGGPARAILDTAAYFAYPCSLLFLVRFFFSYPRWITVEEFDGERAHQLALLRAQRLARLRTWAWLPTPARAVLARLLNRREPREPGLALLASIRWPKWVPVLAVVATALAGADAASWALVSRSHPGWPGALAEVKDLLVLAAFATLLAASVYGISAGLQHQSRTGSPEDRRRIDWVRSTTLAGAAVNLAILIAAWLLAPVAQPMLAQHGVGVTTQALRFWPVAIGFQLLALAFFLSLGMSVFYRGAIDPRLAARKITVFGVLGVVATFLFVLVERAIALYVVALFELSANAGALMAGALIAATIAPLKRQAERAITALAARWLPLDAVIGAERRTLFVAFADLSGYTELAARDEAEAMLLAALLQRLAAKLVRMHGGRVVKAMGDSVLIAFDTPAAASSVLGALHRDFTPAAGQLGLTALAVHSGAHVGEVTVAPDGDIYGQVVNMAARLQSHAAPGQVVVSEAFAARAGGAQWRSLGPRVLRNVPQPVECFEMSTDARLDPASVA